MIKRILAWLKGIYYTAPVAETQTEEATPMTDQVVDPAAVTQPAATEAQPSAPVAAADTAAQSATVSTSALDKAKADFEAFVAFVEHGITVLGADAEAELVALKDKYL